MARKTVSDPLTLTRLIRRLSALQPDTPPQWGTLTAGEMLCHLSDAAGSVLDPSDSEPGRPRPLIKWIALRSPLRWPHGLPTPDSVNPQTEGTRPADFEEDRQRVIGWIHVLASATASDFAAGHGAFGRMSVADWHRWAYRHTDHHLRQFGL